MSKIYISERIGKDIITGDFTKMELKHIDFRRSKHLAVILQGSIIRNCNFNGCNMQEADIDNCSFFSSSLVNTNFSDSYYAQVKFEDCILVGAECSETMFDQCKFITCDMRKVKMNAAYINKCDFSRSNLAFSYLVNAKIENCILDSATLAPLEYRGLQCDSDTLNDIYLANSIAKLLIMNGNKEAEVNGVRIITNSPATSK